eukprot:XP_014042848.1 PREDICTED: uncharacterized protein LOC106596055 isoform X2 [Salmo salar]
MLHIKRFTAGNWEPEKVDDPISIPAELTLPAVCGATAPVQHGARASSMGKNNMDNTPANSPKGTLDRPGHYISDVLDSRGSGWLCLDDAHVLRTDEATVLRATAQTAYILFYVCSGAGEGDQAPHY